MSVEIIANKYLKHHYTLDGVNPEHDTYELLPEPPKPEQIARRLGKLKNGQCVYEVAVVLVGGMYPRKLAWLVSK